MFDANFMLFIAGDDNPKSKNAVDNIKKGLKNKNSNLMVIDILKNPQIAESIGIIATPLLIRTNPEPVRRYIGDFSNSNFNLLI
ncbi:MAG: Circadian clock protein KaiB [Promethearchaeota archaeon]|nr:MAG: Circadian clock protein KaiB [Candidatus Lokiarchaeota archaeon]